MIHLTLEQIYLLFLNGKINIWTFYLKGCVKYARKQI